MQRSYHGPPIPRAFQYELRRRGPATATATAATSSQVWYYMDCYMWLSRVKYLVFNALNQRFIILRKIWLKFFLMPINWKYYGWGGWHQQKSILSNFVFITFNHKRWFSTLLRPIINLPWSISLSGFIGSEYGFFCLKPWFINVIIMQQMLGIVSR